MLSPTMKSFLFSLPSPSDLHLSSISSLKTQEHKMEDKLATFEANHMEEHETANANDNNHGWQKVTYAKRHRKVPAKPSDSGKVLANGSSAAAVGGADKAFRSLEKQSEERRRRLDAQRAAIAAAESDAPVKSKLRSDDEGDDSDAEPAVGVVENGAADEKKAKTKKQKKPKVTVAEAAAKIDAADLAAFLLDISASYESQPDIQLLRFADYFGRAFSAVSASQFPWTKLFRESTVEKIADIPVTHISEDVYKTSVDWINKQSPEALQSFALWTLDSIFADLAGQHPSAKGSRKNVQPVSSKSQVAIFAVLAMVLRRKPEVLMSILPTLREKHQGQDKLPVIVWMTAQACQGDLCAGLYSWAHNLLPVVSGKSSCNPRSRDLILQLVERILSSPKARTILVNGAVKKGERLLPPSAFDLLMRVTFPASSARIKATDRFEAVYPTLKEVALAGSPGSKAMKQVTQQILTFTMEAAGEGNPELAKEATNVFIWCLVQKPDCYKQWDKIYMDNVKASVAILRKLTEEWKEFSAKQFFPEAMRETLKSFRDKNEEALASGEDTTHQELFKNADKYCKLLLGRLSRGRGCMKSLAIAIVALGIGAAVMSPSLEHWDWNNLSVMFTQKSF